MHYVLAQISNRSKRMASFVPSTPEITPHTPPATQETDQNPIVLTGMTHHGVSLGFPPEKLKGSDDTTLNFQYKYYSTAGSSRDTYVIGVSSILTI